MRQITLIALFLLTGAISLINTASAAEAAADFTVTTSAFQDAGTLPTLYTCDGVDTSPDLSWSNPPDKTVSYAIVLSDPEAHDGVFYHWLVYNIPKATDKLDQGIKNYPTGTVIGKNDFGKIQYSGPCPPKGTVHTYVFTLYALDTVLALPAGSDAKTIMSELDKMKSHILKQLQLSAVYSRWAK